MADDITIEDVPTLVGIEMAARAESHGLDVAEVVEVATVSTDFATLLVEASGHVDGCACAVCGMTCEHGFTVQQFCAICDEGD